MHRPVLYQEIIHALRPRQGGHYVDATLGAGGHAQGILRASQPDGSLLGLDVDPEALAIARQRLAPFGERAILVRASYTTMVEQLQALSWEQVDGVVLDLGVSSMQLESTERGFSFRYDAPLDMRFDPENPESAAYLVNTLPEAELADLISRYGEEHRARRVAHAIVQARPIGTTRQLAQVVASVTSGGRPGIASRHAHLSGIAHCCQPGAGGVGTGITTGGFGARASRTAGCHFFSFTGGQNCQTIHPPGEQGLPVPAEAAHLHLWA